ncbi:hypothetical protein I4U23_029009 [Adineta vaga]|nr:hypothetical protein I4U23_029009 [Adineta vaga]
MSTPILNPNSTLSSSMKTNANAGPTVSQYQLELGQFLCKHDPAAIRLYDFINHVKVFRYNSSELRWENNPCIEGNLFLYKRQQIINDQMYAVFAFAIIHEERNLIQIISDDMTEQANNQCLFYEIKRNNQSLVYSLHFSNENECLRVHKFIQKLLQSIKEQQNRLLLPGELQQKQMQAQAQLGKVDQLQTTVNRPNSVAQQLGPSRQPELRISGRQSTPITNSNVRSNDQTSSLKRLLNIPNQTVFDNESSLPSTQNSVNLLPPSAFATVSSSMGANYSDNQSVSQTYPSNLLDREHLRNVLLHLVQTNDQFIDIIHQACLNHST